MKCGAWNVHGLFSITQPPKQLWSAGFKDHHGARLREWGIQHGRMPASKTAVVSWVERNTAAAAMATIHRPTKPPQLSATEQHEPMTCRGFIGSSTAALFVDPPPQYYTVAQLPLIPATAGYEDPGYPASPEVQQTAPASQYGGYTSKAADIEVQLHEYMMIELSR